MSPLFKLPVSIGTLLLATTAAAADPAYIGHYQGTPQDVAAIKQLTQDFHDALVAKNAGQFMRASSSGNAWLVRWMYSVKP